MSWFNTDAFISSTWVYKTISEKDTGYLYIIIIAVLNVWQGADSSRVLVNMCFHT